MREIQENGLENCLHGKYKSSQNTEQNLTEPDKAKQSVEKV